MLNIKALVHEATREPYEFANGDEKWRVPHVAEMTFGQQVDADVRLDKVVGEVAEIFDEDAGEWRPAGRKGIALIRSMHTDQLGAFRAAWLAHAGLKPGESQASSR